MIQAQQFIAWLFRKAFGGMFDGIAAIPGLLTKHKNYLRNEPVPAFLIWVLTTLSSGVVVVLLTLVVAAITGAKEVTPIPMLITGGVGVAILIVNMFRVFYDLFREDQQRIMSALSNQEIDED